MGGWVSVLQHRQMNNVMTSQTTPLNLKRSSSLSSIFNLSACQNDNASHFWHTSKEQAETADTAAKQYNGEQGVGEKPDAGNCSVDAPTDSRKQLSILERLGLHRVDLTEMETETAFVHLSLAFKCDMFTLQKRLQIEERSRDVAEDNIRLELQSCRSMVQKLKSFCLDVRRREAIQQLENSLEVLANATERLSHAAEILGAVHQEARVSRAVEIMLRHVENLKRHRIREHTELEEMKRLINHKPMSQQSAECQEDGELRSRYQIMKSFHQAAAARRRVSIAVIPKPFMNFHMSDSKGSNSDRQSMESDLPKQVGENRQQDSRHPFYHLDDSLLENFAQDVDSFSSRHSLLTTDSSEQEGDILYSFNREVGGLRKPGEEKSLQVDRWTENIKSEELEIQSKMSECLQTLLRGLLLLLPLSEHHWLLLQLTLLLLLCAVVIGVLVWQRCGQTSDS